jgi:transposase
MQPPPSGPPHLGAEHLGPLPARSGTRSRSPSKKPGRKPKGVSEELAARIKALAEAYPWWGYKRIGVMARREGLGISNKQVYRVFKAYGLLQRKRVREAALYQAARLCPKRPMSCGRPM